jgi:hypothetical protein
MISYKEFTNLKWVFILKIFVRKRISLILPRTKKKESEIEKPVPFIMQQYVYYRKHADQ